MTEGTDTTATVLIVDDEEDLADLYAAWLTDAYDVRTAYGGADALDAFDSDVDIVLLDRRMPDMSGDEVLERIRQQGSGCQVVMVTAVDPDFDILEMGFDGYVTKPVDQEGLETVIEKMLTRRSYGQNIQEYYRLVAKRAALEEQKSETELTDSAEFTDLLQEIETAEKRINSAIAEFEEEDFEAAFRDLNDSG